MIRAPLCAVRSVIIALMVAMVSGCNPFSAADSMMDDYVERVARVLEADPVYSDLPEVPTFPRRRDRVLSIPDIDISMLDFLSLYGCQLQFVVGERNSVLGRVMQPLNRLRYEIRFTEAARECLPDITREDLKQSVLEALDHKQEILPRVIWNATWGVEEVESLFSRSDGYLPPVRDHPTDPVAELSAGVEHLNRVVADLRKDPVQADLEAVSALHQQWLASARAGQAINSARLLMARLGDARDIILKRIEGRPLCINGQPNNQSDIARNMFFNVYVDRVQPYMARVTRARDSLITGLSVLAEQQSGVMPGAFEPWYRQVLQVQGESSLWSQLDEAIQDHTEAWQTLLEQCGLRPGQ